MKMERENPISLTASPGGQDIGGGQDSGRGSGGGRDNKDSATLLSELLIKLKKENDLGERKVRVGPNCSAILLSELLKKLKNAAQEKTTQAISESKTDSMLTAILGFVKISTNIDNLDFAVQLFRKFKYQILTILFSC